MNAKIKIRFLRDVNAPQAVYRSHCECCGPENEGWYITEFYKDDEIDPDELYHQVDLRGLKFGEDYTITSFLPDEPNRY